MGTERETAAWGEHPPDPENLRGAVVSFLADASRNFREKHFARPVTTFTDTAGNKHRASSDQVDIPPNEEGGEIKVWLKTHNREITMTVAGLLVAAGAIAVQRNRSQRKRMSNRGSSFKRKPRDFRKK